MNYTIPRIIWTCWWQGEEQAPALVRACFDSWAFHNPGWRINIVDRTNVSDIGKSFPLFAQPERIPIQAFSDVLRIAVLKTHGGVWVDASLLCRTSLDNRLHVALRRSGFFAFRAPGPDRPLSSWFLAAASGNQIIDHWHHDVFEYWRATHAERGTVPTCNSSLLPAHRLAHTRCRALSILLVSLSLSKYVFDPRGNRKPVATNAENISRFSTFIAVAWSWFSGM